MPHALVRPAIRIITLLTAAVLLAAVAIVNGGPIYYPDSAAYLMDADRLAVLRAPFAVRPVFYGVAIWPLRWYGSFLPAVLLQGLIVGHVIDLTLRACDCRVGAWSYLGLVAALVVLTPVSFHVSHLLPDIFVSVLILALFLLAFCVDRLYRFEAGYLLLLATAAASFHLTALPVGAALFVVSLAIAVVARRHWVAPLLVLAPLLLAAGMSLGFSFVVWQRLTLAPNSPPHILARVLADGPGRDYLRAACPQAGFALCDYQDRLTGVEDEFLWRLLTSVPEADGYRIRAEQVAVLQGAFRMYPAQIIEHMVANTLRQLVTFESVTQVSPAEWDAFQRAGLPLARSLQRSLQGAGGLDRPALATVNALHAGVAAFSAAALLVLTVLAVRARLFRPVALAAMVSTGLVANAFACGAFGGVFPRYEGRVIWLLPFAALVSGLALLRARPAVRRRTIDGFQATSAVRERSA